MRRTVLASIVLSAMLVPATAVLAQDKPDRGSPPPTRPSGGGDGTGGGERGKDGGDGVRGPRVPGGAREGDRGFGSGKGDRAGNIIRGDEVETTAWLKALEVISRDFNDDQAARVKTFKEEWKTVADKWRTENGEKMKTLQKKLSDARKGGGTPDAVQMDEMKRLLESKPKFEPYRKKISAVFSPEQAVAHKEAFELQKQSMKPMGKPEGREGKDGKDGKPGRGSDGKPGDSPDRKTPPTRGTGGGAGGTGGGDKPADKPTDKPAAKNTRS